MPVDKKAGRFVNRLARKLNPDECATMGEAKFRAMFQTAVDDLPDNKKLKHFLVENFDTYFNKLWSTVQGIPAVPASDEQRYNLLAAGGLLSALSWVGTLSQAEQIPHYLSLFQRCFPSAEGSDALLDSIIHSCKNDLHCLATLTQLLHLNKQAVALQKVAAAFVRRLEEAYSNCLQENTQERAAELREIVLRFMTVLNIQRNPADKWEDPAYEDLVAALVSMYVDLSLLVPRTQQSSDSPGVVPEVSQSIGNCILVWLGHSPTHILDVLLQSEPDSERDGDILTPVYRRFLHTAPSPLTHESYIRYVCAVCKAREIIPQNSPTWKTLEKAALSTPAPPGFLSWLRTRSAYLMDQVPNTPKWRGSHVTQFLILESTQDFRENMLDLLTEGLEEPVNGQQPEAKVQKDETRPGSDTDLFFVDTTKDEDTAVQMGLDDTGVAHSHTETQLLGEIHSVLGRMEVGQDIPEGKDSGDESDVEEVEFQVPKSKAKRKQEVDEVVARTLQTYRKGYITRKAQGERDSTSGPWAVKNTVSPLQGTAGRAGEMDSKDSSDAEVVFVDLESSKEGNIEESKPVTAEVVSKPQEHSADDSEQDETEEQKPSAEKVEKAKKEKGKKKGKKESKDKGSRKHDKVGRSFEDLKLQEGESYDSSQESVEMMAFKASASELLEDVEKFMNTTKQGTEELQEDLEKVESKADKSGSMEEQESADNVEDSEANSFQAKSTVSEDEQEENSSELSPYADGAEEELAAQSVSQKKGISTVEEQGQEVADVQDEAQSIPDSQESDSEDDGPKILKLRRQLDAPASTAEPNLNQSDVIPLAGDGNEGKTGEVVVQGQNEKVVEETPTASIMNGSKRQKENIFKTPVSPVRGKSSPSKVQLSSQKASPGKATGVVASPTKRRRRLSTDEEIHEIAAEVTKKIAGDNIEDEASILTAATPPSKLSEVRRRSMLGQSYGKYIEKQTFPDMEETETDTTEVVNVEDQTEKNLSSADVTSVQESKSQELSIEKETESKETEDIEVEVEGSSGTECSGELDESSKMILLPKNGAKEIKQREPTPMVKRDRRKPSQQTLQPVGEEPRDEDAPDSGRDLSDSSLSSSNRRQSLRRRKLEMKEKGEAEQSRKGLQDQCGSEDIAGQLEKVVPEAKNSGEASASKARQSKALRMVQSPTPKKSKGEEHSIKLVSPQGSPEWQFATGGHIVVKVSSNSPEHRPTVVQSPTGELIIKAYNPKVVVAPDFTGSPKKLDFDGTADKDGGHPKEETGTKRDASSASLDFPQAKMVLRARSKSPVPSDSSSLTSISSMSDTASGSRRRSQRSIRKASAVPLTQLDVQDVKDMTLPDVEVPSTSGSRPQRRRASRDPKVTLEVMRTQRMQVSDSDLSVSSQSSSSSRRRSKAAGVVVDSQLEGLRRSARKRAKDKEKETPPKKVKMAGEEGEEEEGPEVIVLEESSPNEGTREDQPEPVAETRPVGRRRVKRESESTVSEVLSDVDMFSLSPPRIRRTTRLKAVHETLSNASSLSEQSAVDSEQEGSISSRTRSSHKRRSVHAGSTTRSTVKADSDVRKRLSMLT